jgi:SAM-dependent methyltransferase
MSALAKPLTSSTRARRAAADGASGWDEYAAFYDWENARTVGRSDVAFWRRLVRVETRAVLELGCGTGRLLMPIARACAGNGGGQPLVAGIDRSAPMLARAVARSRRMPAGSRPVISRGDIRALPFRPRTFGVVLAPYGMLQSLVRDCDLDATLASVARVLRRGGLFGIDLVPDLPSWDEYRRRVSLRGRMRSGSTVTLIESVRQDRRKRLTIFDQQFVERREGRQTTRAFSLTFRTLPVPEVVGHLARAGFVVEAMFGDYRGAPWHPGAETWLILARRR